MADQETDIASRIVPGLVRRRFLVKFLVAVVLAMVVTAGIGGFLYLQASNTLEEQVEREVASTAAQQADTLGNWIDSLRLQTQTLSRSATFQGGAGSQIQMFIAAKLETFPEEVSAIAYVNASTGEIVSRTGPPPIDESYANRSTPWARNLDSIDRRTDNSSTVVVADRPYRSPATGEEVIGFITAPPNNPDNLIVVEANLSSRDGAFYQTSEGGFTRVRHESGETVYDGSPGYSGDPVTARASVPGTDWTLVSHIPTESAFALQGQIETILVALIVVPLVLIGGAAAVIGRRTGTALSDLADQAASVESGSLQEGIEIDRADEIGDLADSLDSMRRALEERIREAEQARKQAEVARSEAVEVNEYLQDRADEYAETMQRCAAGDLTQRMEPDGENDAMDRIAGEFNQMIDELEKTTGQLENFAEQVESAGEEVRASAESVRDAAEGIADSVQQVSSGAHDQQEVLADVRDALQQVTDAVRTVGEDADVDGDEVLEQAERAMDHLDAAVDRTDDLLEASERISATAQEQAAELNEVSGRAADLTRYARPLRQVIDRFETESEHEFFFPTGPGSPPPETAETPRPED